MTKRLGVSRRVLLGFVPWIGVVAVWYGIRASGYINLSLIPAPHQVAAKFVELVLHEGLLFDVYMTHGARPNTGSRPRAGYALRFMPATSHYDHDSAIPGGDTSRESKALFLVRGVDRSGRNDLQRGHGLG